MIEEQDIERLKEIFVTAAAIGVVSGLAATGAHQVYKQLTSDGKEE